MQTTIQKQSIKQDLMILVITATIAVTFIGYRSTIASPYYFPTSKIEESTIVVKDESVTTIIIPDKR